jgi:Pyruvate/2-oxoacid:ferredoxin oxidoreductase delta subunit
VKLAADHFRPTVTIDARCTACGACIVTCPETALLPAPRRPLVLDDRCTGCLACIEVCPAGAVSEGRQ